MTIQELAISKIQLLSEPLAREVNDFIDFLLQKQGGTEEGELAEIGMGDYSRSLSDYEDRLARGEILW